MTASPSVGTRRIAGILFLFAALASMALYASDRSSRASVERFVQRFGIDRRHPADVEAMALEPAGDLASAMVVTSEFRPGRTAEGEGRAEGDSSTSGYPQPSADEIRASLDSILDAVAFRPGWPSHRYVLGLVEFASARLGGERSGPVRLWDVALRQAITAAPGMDDAWTALGEADLSFWGDLLPAERARAVDVFRRCFRTEEFVTSHFRDVEVAMGRQGAVDLLPDDPDVLEVAAGMLAEDADVQGASGLLSRLDKAERRERAEDLRRLEQRKRRGDVDSLRVQCREWFDQHPFGDFDDPVGRREVARLLELWPDDRFGSWARDRRGRLVRFFLDGRESDAPGVALLRAIESLTGVPDAVRARVLLQAGDLSGARSLAGRARDRDSSDWDSFYVGWARWEANHRNPIEARAALRQVSLTGRGSCDALILRREIGKALGDADEARVAEDLIATLRMAPSDEWSARGRVSLCLDPEWTAGRRLEIGVGEGQPAILSFGWAGGRAGTVSLSAEPSRIDVPLSGVSGARDFWVSYLVGGARPLHVALRQDS